MNPQAAVFNPNRQYEQTVIQLKIELIFTIYPDKVHIPLSREHEYLILFNTKAVKNRITFYYHVNYGLSRQDMTAPLQCDNDTILCWCENGHMFTVRVFDSFDRRQCKCHICYTEALSKSTSTEVRCLTNFYDDMKHLQYTCSLGHKFVYILTTTTPNRIGCMVCNILRRLNAAKLALIDDQPELPIEFTQTESMEFCPYTADSTLYINTTTPIRLTCKECGKQFWVSDRMSRDILKTLKYSSILHCGHHQEIFDNTRIWCLMICERLFGRRCDDHTMPIRIGAFANRHPTFSALSREFGFAIIHGGDQEACRVRKIASMYAAFNSFRLVSIPVTCDFDATLWEIKAQFQRHSMVMGICEDTSEQRCLV